MKEEIFISGRNLPNIDPHLHIWHWPIALDLFMGGLAAGILFFAAYYTITGKEKEMPNGLKWSVIVAPFAIIIALICLFFDLKHKLYFWQLYTTFRPESPMSFGSWVLLFITPLSFLWAASYVKELIPSWNWKPAFLNEWLDRFSKLRGLTAWPLLILAVSLGIYTGILLSAFNARPLWNTSLLGPMFLVYGMTTGAALILWFTKEAGQQKLFSKILLALIAIDIFFIIHLFMGFLAGPAVQVEAAELFITGEYALPFWGFVVLLGLLIPALMELLYLRGFKVPATIPVALILIGGFLFRYLLVEAGEMTRYLY
ncbi:MAG: polysulfide reductase NrfD [Saprospiraceae bacterium]|nr:polysulfide reductase NrfD [Saprospiraceae bacterium]